MKPGIIDTIVFSLLFSSALTGAAFIIRKRWGLARLGSPYETNTSTGQKLKSLLVNVLLQKKVMKFPVRGLFHLFIFFGFFVYVIHTLSQFTSIAVQDYLFYYPAFLGEGGLWLYDNLLDLFTVLVLLGLLYFAIRRFVLVAPELDRPSVQSIIVLKLIFMLMAFTVIELPARAVLEHAQGVTWLRQPLFSVMQGGDPEVTKLFFLIGWWGHVLSIFAFMIYVPLSKHGHLLWAPVNFWFASDKPRGKMLDLDVEKAEVWGANNVHEFSWKNHIDGLACIECGRCELLCPANRTGKPLSPKKIIVDLKHSLTQKMPEVQKRLAAGEERSAISEAGGVGLVDSVITRDELWACTSCYACVETCPVGNDQLEPILQMRRWVVLNEGAMPAQLSGAMSNMENQSNPWGLSAQTRADWAEGLGVKTMAEWKSQGESPEILYWVGCAGAFDERNKKIARDLSSLMQKAGVTFGILGTEESCTGDSARRAGNEYLFQTLAQANVDLLNSYGITKIVTACPHCMNTLKNEYPTFGGNYEVVHHSQFLSGLLAQGKLKLKEGQSGEVCYHDSCYLGRYNGVYDAPRDLLTKSGLRVQEPAEHHEKAMCCGAGGAQMWMEEQGSERVNLHRTEDLLASGAASVATACPFCITMVSDAVKAKGAQEQHQVYDIAEILIKGVQ